MTISAGVRLINNCPLCSSKNTKSIRTERNTFPEGVHPEVRVFDNTWSHLVECRSCSFAFIEEIPSSPTFFSNRYDNTWFDPEHEVASFRKTEILNTLFNSLKHHGVVKGRLLDVGSFAGKLLHFSKLQGFEPEGVEINPKLAKFCNEKLGFKVYSGQFQDVTLPENHFNVITIIDVLEHLVGPREVVMNMQKSLVPGGLIYIKVPHYPMQIVKQNIANIIGASSVGMCANFAHINHFTVESMRKLFVANGMELVEVQVAKSEHWRPDASFWKLRNLFRDFIWKATSLIYKMGGPCLGLNLIFIGRKK